MGILVNLPSGRTIEFPDFTPDAAIDEAVQHHIKKDAQDAEQQESEERTRQRREKELGDANTRASKEMHGETMRYRKERDARGESNRKEDVQRKTQWRKEDQAAETERHAASAAMNAKTQYMMSELLTSVTDLNRNIAALSQKLEGVEKLEGSVSSVAESLMAAAKMIVDTLHLPKKITFGQGGRPTGLKLEYSKDEEE